MKEKDLKKLNRYQLLELLIVQTERADKLSALLEDAEKRLVEQELRLSSLGSIAEASLELNGVFKAAQDAADQYVNAAKRHADEIEKTALRKGARIIAKALKEAGRIKGKSSE